MERKSSHIIYLIPLFVCLATFLNSYAKESDPKAFNQMVDDIMVYELQSDDSVKEKTKHWLDLLEQKDYQSNEIQALLHAVLSLSSFSSGNLELAESTIKKAEKLTDYNTSNFNERALMFIYNTIGSNYFYNENNVFKANEYYLKALKYAIANDNHVTVDEKSLVFTNCSEIATLLKNHDDVLNINQIALEVYKGIKKEDRKNLFTFYSYSDMFNTYFNLDKDNNNQAHSASIEYCFNEAKKLVPNPDKNRLYIEMQGKYELYQNKIDSAIYYFNKLLAIDTNFLKQKKVAPISASRAMNAHALLAKTYLKANQLKNADEQLKAANRILKQYGPYAKHLLINLKETEQDYYYKTNNLTAYKKVTDELSSIHKEIYQEPQKVMNVVEFEKKEASINQLKNTVSEKESIIRSRNIIYISLFLLSALGFYTFYVYRKNTSLKEEAKKALLEQRLLRTQIQPHFMFNTLNTLGSLIKLDRKRESIDFLENFGHLLRNSLEFSRVELITLHEEIETLESYIELQQIRFNNFDFNIKIDETIETEKVEIPPMLLQPFIENCIVHAFPNNLNRKGNIDVIIKKEHNNLTIEIADNGTGISVKDNEEAHQSLANKITRERLEILSRIHNKKANYTIHSVPNKGTTIKITLPVHWK